MPDTTRDVPPAPDTAPATDILYTTAMDQLTGQTVQLYTNVQHARAATGVQRQTFLAQLHHQVQGMAGILNATLGAVEWLTPGSPRSETDGPAGQAERRQ